MAMLIKLAGEAGISLPEILFWRQFLTVPLVLGFLARTGGPRSWARMPSAR